MNPAVEDVVAYQVYPHLPIAPRQGVRLVELLYLVQIHNSQQRLIMDGFNWD